MLMTNSILFSNTSKEGPFSSTNSAYAFAPLRSFVSFEEADGLVATFLTDKAATASDLGSARDELLKKWFDHPDHAQIE